MIQLLAGAVWGDDELAYYLNQDAPRRAAIAYVGRAAEDLLNLQSGDTIMVDGSDSAVAGGSVDPKMIQPWVDYGVNVRSLPGLHAKVVLIEGRESVAVVGSANASAHSRDDLIEAVLVSSEPELCAQLGDQLDQWHADSEPIGG